MHADALPALDLTLGITYLALSVLGMKVSGAGAEGGILRYKCTDMKALGHGWIGYVCMYNRVNRNSSRCAPCTHLTHKLEQMTAMGAAMYTTCMCVGFPTS